MAPAASTMKRDRSVQRLPVSVATCAVSDPAPGEGRAHQALRHATLGSARSALLDDRLGAIKPGYKADLVLLDMKDTAYLPFNSAARQLVYTETGRAIDTVVINQDVKWHTIGESAPRGVCGSGLVDLIAEAAGERPEVVHGPERPGDVRLVMKHLPLGQPCNRFLDGDMHPQSCRATAAALCAQELRSILVEDGILVGLANGGAPGGRAEAFRGRDLLAGQADDGAVAAALAVVMVGRLTQKEGVHGGQGGRVAGDSPSGGCGGAGWTAG